MTAITPHAWPEIAWVADANGFIITMQWLHDPGTGQWTITMSEGQVDPKSIIVNGQEAKVTFQRSLDTGEVQTWTGYLFDWNLGTTTLADGAPAFDGEVTFTLAMAGVITTEGGFEDPNRPGFGWFALGGAGAFGPPS
jgi:hypothetical protein